MEFRCRVATASGQVMEATYVAENEARLRVELEDRGLFLLSVQGASGVKLGAVRLSLPKRRRVPMRDFLVFNQEMATLLKAGLPLVQSLDILRRRIPNPVFKTALDDVYDKVRSGSSLSEAFEAQKLFSGVYTASLMAGEKSGSLETVIRRYVHHVKIMASVRSHVISALIYPCILVGLSAVVIALMVFKVIPEFAGYYGQMGSGAQLPMSTQMVLSMSTTLAKQAYIIFPALAAIIASIVIWYRDPAHKKQVHQWILKLPFFGPLARTFATAQVARTLSTLLSGGIPLVNSLDIAAKSVGNRSIADHLLICAKEVREGSSLGIALNKRNIFPHIAVEMVEVGESTGALADMLNSVAEFYDEENETAMTRFSNAVQPAVLIVMGGIIAGLLLSLYMPMFQLASLQS